MLATSVTGCAEKSCNTTSLAAGDFSGSGGPARFRVSVVEPKGSSANNPATRQIQCVKFTILNAYNYADTLYSNVITPTGERISITDLPTAEVDILIDREGYFPIKLAGVSLNPGANNWHERLLLYSSDAPVALPGEVGITLKKGVDLETLRSVYAEFDALTVKSTPWEDYFELEFRRRDIKTLRRDVERLCRKMVDSRFIVEARPLVNMNSVVPSL